MWQTPREGVEKNTAAIASDNQSKKEELEDCNCSDQQKQSINSKKQKSTTLSSKSSKVRSVDKIKDNKATESVAEAADSGFISGPQSEPIDFEEEEPKTGIASESVNTTTEGSQRKPADKVDIRDNDEGAVGGHGVVSSKDCNRSLKLIADEEHVGYSDSGCIVEEFDEANTDENSAEPGQVKREISSATVDATKPSAATFTATEESINKNTPMKFNQSVDAGVSEWMCKSDNQITNNLNSVSGRRTPMTATNPTTTSTSIGLRSEAGNTTNINRTPAFPWERCYKQNDDGDTALHLACIAGYIEVITALIRMAPHPCLFNIQNDDAQTSLHLAALTVQPNVLRVLLLAGAEPTVRDRHGNTALHLACIAGEIQCVRALTEPFAASEIHEAHRQYGHRSNDKALSSLNYARLPSDLEIRNYDGERCVHIAAQGGHIEILRILVSHGADINAREGKSGRTPLHIAIECRNEDLANFLLDECEKLNLETATYAGLTAYQVAQILDNAQMQNILQKRGAEPLTPPDSDSDYDSSDMEDSDDGKFYDRFGDPRYFVNYSGGGNRMTVA